MKTTTLKLGWLFAALIFSWISPGFAQTQVPHQQLLLLVAGPSGDRIDPREKAVVDHLNSLRSNYNFSQLQMGTMHYDRPQEAALLKNTLGFSAQKGVTVGLVQLSESGIPIRTLYKMEQVTQGSLLAAQNDLLSRWSQYTGQPLPTALRPAGSVGGPTSSGTSTPTNTTSAGSTNQPWIPTTTPTEVYTFEGIHTVVNGIDETAGQLWGNLMNAPLRSDGNDVKVREQSKALSEATAALRAAHESGVIYPMEQLASVARIGRAWQNSEPQYYLPVPLRGQVEPMKKWLTMIEEIHAQGSKAPK